MFTCLFEIFTLHLPRILKLLIMKTNYLFPYNFKKIGWILFIPGVILAVIYFLIDTEPNFLDFKVFSIADEQVMGASAFFKVTKTNILDEMIGLLLIVGSIFIALSKQKHEDEFISKIRLESLVWATYLNYSILLFAIIFIYSMSFFWVLVGNMFTLLIFFTIRFNWVLYKSKKLVEGEK